MNTKDESLTSACCNHNVAVQGVATKLSVKLPALVSSTGTPVRLMLRGGEVAALLGISKSLAFRWMATGILPTVRIPGARSVRVPAGALLDWVEKNTRAGEMEV